jgi:hypothetical protein
VKFPTCGPLPVFLAVLLSLASGCAPQPPAAIGPSPREQELTHTVAELREQLAVAEREIQQLKTTAEQSAAKLTVERTTTEKANETATPSPEAKVTDTSYVVVKKTFVAGKLISRATSTTPNATERQPADCRITFKGVNSGKVYPELEIQELAFAGFREGVAYSAQDIIQGKKPVRGVKAPGAPSASSPTQIEDPQLRALFGL